jgi:hypothetical protein
MAPEGAWHAGTCRHLFRFFIFSMARHITPFFPPAPDGPDLRASHLSRICPFATLHVPSMFFLVRANRFRSREKGMNSDEHPTSGI